MLRNRLLSARGWQVVSVPVAEWEGLGADDQQRASFLMGRLEAHLPQQGSGIIKAAGGTQALQASLDGDGDGTAPAPVVDVSAPRTTNKRPSSSSPPAAVASSGRRTGSGLGSLGALGNLGAIAGETAE